MQLQAGSDYAEPRTLSLMQAQNTASGANATKHGPSTHVTPVIWSPDELLGNPNAYSVTMSDHCMKHFAPFEQASHLRKDIHVLRYRQGKVVTHSLMLQALEHTPTSWTTTPTQPRKE